MREARQLLPSFDEWGIRPAGLRGPHSNPWAAELEQVGETPEPEEAEDSGEDGAQRGDNPSGEERASRSADRKSVV